MVGIGVHGQFAEVEGAHGGVLHEGSEQQVIGITVAGFGLFGTDYVVNVVFDLVVDFGHLHEAGVGAVYVDLADGFHHHAHLGGVDVVAGLVIVGDTLGNFGAAGFDPAGAVVPHDKHIMLGGVVGLGPFHEGHYVLVVAHVGFAQVLQDGGSHLVGVGVLLNKEAGRAGPGHRAVAGDQAGLCYHVHFIGGAYLLHLVHIFEGVRHKVVLAVHVDHNGPFFVQLGGNGLIFNDNGGRHAKVEVGYFFLQVGFVEGVEADGSGHQGGY